MTRRRNQNRMRSEERKVMLIHTINRLMREHKLNSSDFVRIVLEHASNDALEDIRNAIPLERIRMQAMKWDNPE